jgi:hypothetical protein
MLFDSLCLLDQSSFSCSIVACGLVCAGTGTGTDHQRLSTRQLSLGWKGHSCSLAGRGVRMNVTLSPERDGVTYQVLELVVGSIGGLYP